MDNNSFIDGLDSHGVDDIPPLENPMDITIEVIIPLYKGIKTIRAALDSLVAQTRKDFLTVVIIDGDDGYFEEYCEIFEEYTRRGLNIRATLLPVNVGPGMARQEAIDMSQSDFLMFLDADDMLMPKAVEDLTKEIALDDRDIVMSSMMVEKNGACFLGEAGKISVSWMHGKIYRRSFLTELNIRFLPEILCNEDSYFNLVAVNCARKRADSAEITYLWRENPESLTRTSDGGSFFERTNHMYIYGQVKGLQKIYEINNKLEPLLISSTLRNIYYAMQKQKALNVEEYSYLDALKELQDFEPLQKYFQSSQNWIEIATNVKAALVEETSVVFYKENFFDWVCKYLWKDRIVKEKEE